MDNSIKLCPICGMPINEGENVTICQSCGIVYHTGCWVNNGGCTTPGCPQNAANSYANQQYNIPQAAPAPASVCATCGQPLTPGLAFCPRCGQPAAIQPAPGAVNPAISQYNANVNTAKKGKGGKIGLILGIVAAVAAVAVAVVLIVTGVFKSVDDHLAGGEYEKAYEKAETVSEKNEVLKENQIAICCSKCIDSLKDPSSFSLNAVWHNASGKSTVLSVSAKNGYGNTTTEYWFYYYDTTENDWVLWDAYDTSFTEKELNIYADDATDVLLYNLGIPLCQDIMNDKNRMPGDVAQRINDLFKKDKLYTVIPLNKEFL